MRLRDEGVAMALDDIVGNRVAFRVVVLVFGEDGFSRAQGSDASAVLKCSHRRMVASCKPTVKLGRAYTSPR